MIIAVDTETTGLEETDRPFCATISTPDFDYYTESPSEAAELIAPATKVLMQNAKFDARMLSHWGINAFDKPVYDITPMARILRNDYLQYSLAAQAKRHGMEKSTAVDEAIKAGKHYETRRNFFGQEYKVPRYDRVDREILKKYALLDSRITRRLGIEYFEKADADDLKLMHMESKLTPVCYRMERTGLMLNQEYTLAGYHKESQQLKEKMELWKDVAGTEFVDSAKSIQKNIMYVLPTTDKGNPSVTDDVIEDILKDSYTCDEDRKKLSLVREMRTYKKRINTYYESYLNLKDRGGIIHPFMWQAGTRTGRFSYSDPNLQNIPKEEGSESDFVIRGCFKPRPGYKYISMDYSQMEYRMMADYAGENHVITAVMGGADFHQVTADMFGVSRKYAKTLNFAILYGAGVNKIAAMLGISVEEATRLKNKYFMALPKVEQLVDDVIAVGRGRGYVRSWSGRKLYADREFCYALPNHLIQSGGADVVKKAMIEIDEYINREGNDIKMVLQIHDQLIFEVPIDAPSQWILDIKEIMESQYISRTGAMRLVVDISESEISLAERDMRKWHAA